MLGFRLNKLGAAMRSGLDLRSLYGGGASGFLPKLDNADYDRQLYNAPATNAASAGDPIGLWLPSQSPTDVTNLLLWTDAFDNAAWTKSNAAVTANVFANLDGVPTMDRFVPSAGAADHILNQDVLTQDLSLVRTFAIDLKADGITNYVVYMRNAAQSIGIQANIDLSAVTATANNYGSPTSATTPTITALANGGYRVTIGGALSATTETLKVGIIRNYTADGTSGLGVARAQLNLGSTALAYQPNAGCLGGSNRRTGGSNMLLWSQELSNSYYTPTSCTVTENTVAAPDGTTTADTLTEAAGAGLLPRLPVGMTVEVGQTYTISIYAKETAGSKRYLQLYTNGAFPLVSAGANFDLATGTASNVTSGYTAAAVSVGNGWWRCYVTTPAATGTGTGWRYALQDSASAAMAATYNPDGTGSMYLWGAQVNIGSLATYSRNMDQLGGLLLSAPLYQSTSANRGTLARRPASGIRNQIRNNTMQGAALPATSPTNWGLSTTNPELTCTVAALGTEDGIEYIDLTISGTVTASRDCDIRVESTTFIPAVSGQTWVGSAYFRQVGGSQTNITFVALQANCYTSGGAYVTTPWADTPETITTAALSTQRKSQSAGLSGATIAYICPFIKVRTASSGVVNLTLRIGLPQLERNSSATAVQRTYSAANITEDGQPDVWHTYWDGTSDFGTFGVQSFGSASLFADAGQAWTAWGVFRTLSSSNQVIVAKATSAASRTFQLFFQNSDLKFAGFMRGVQFSTTPANLNDGNFHVWVARWNGTVLQIQIDRNSAELFAPGSDAEESQNITVSARTESSPSAWFNGHNDVAMIDRALSDAEMAQLMSNLNATYRAGL